MIPLIPFRIIAEFREKNRPKEIRLSKRIIGQVADPQRVRWLVRPAT